MVTTFPLIVIHFMVAEHVMHLQSLIHLQTPQLQVNLNGLIC